MVPISVVILTFQESIHIKRVIQNTINFAKDVFVVDSMSRDGTQEIAEKLNAKVYTKNFISYSDQREWVLRNLPFTTEWILFLDADELLTDDLIFEINKVIKQSDNEIKGYYIKRRFYWMGKWLKHGGMYPIWILRLVKHKYAKCNPRAVNEHIEVEGNTGYLKNDFLHIDLKSISEWIAKHNKYATLEAQEQWKVKTENNKDTLSKITGTQVERKRWIRENIWNKMIPPLLRPFLYFFYVYIIRFGFLDGKAGFIYHVLHGFSYRFMIETKYLTLKKNNSESVN